MVAEDVIAHESWWIDSCDEDSAANAGGVDVRWTISTRQPRKFLTME